MLIKEAVIEECNKCGRYVRELEPEQHGCDQCKKPIEPYGNDERLDVSVFHNDNKTSTERFYFCSWACVFRFVRNLKPDYFFTLPYVCADNKIKGRRAKDFFRIVRRFVGAK